MTKLSVNINKIATLRNSRGGNTPNVLKAAIDVQNFGADGVTVHPRPDQRHIKYKDVYEIRPIIKTEFNIEGYPSPQFMELVKAVHPHQVTLVPDPPDALTSNSGWDTINHLSFLQDIIGELKECGIRTSIFMDPDPDLIINAAKTNTDRIELYTEPYATMYPQDPEKAIAPFIEAANIANKAGLRINAGHDLNLQNLKFFNERIPFLKEVSIGHALISDALYYGLELTINKYKELLIRE
ncbi:pyridoxine 5'-phosphate synthase [Thermophagus sp. OGC60D27]|uniref:pyridoxine 5'-phosphate synthase n=1 Tax=Thermophagus sp. OGC60D27 TaxID=3458415 RepID=UPI004037EC49